MSRQIVVEIVGDASGFNKSVSGAITKTEGISGKLKGVGKGMVIGAGIASFNLLAGAIDLGVSKLGEAADAFREDQKSAALLAQSLKNNVPAWNGSTAAVEAYATAQGRLGFTDDEVRASLGKLVGITHDQTKAMKLNSLAQDAARAKGISLEAATNIVTKAAQANGKALKSLGVDIGGAKTAAEMLDAVQKNVTGSAETWAATNEGKLSVSNVAVGEAMEKVGGIVDRVAQVAIPALTEALTWASENVLPPLTEAFEWIGKNVLPKVGQVFNWIGKNVLPPLIATVQWFSKEILPSLTAAFDWIATNILPKLGAAFNWIVTNVLPPVRDAITFVVQKVIPPLVTVLSGVAKVATEVFSTVASVVRGAFNTVVGLINGIIGAINGVQIHVDIPFVGKIDWNGLGLPRLPYLHSGGIVPGRPGQDVLAVLQAGERVTPAKSSGAGLVVNVYGNIYGPSGVDELTDMIALRLRLHGA